MIVSFGVGDVQQIEWASMGLAEAAGRLAIRTILPIWHMAPVCLVRFPQPTWKGFQDIRSIPGLPKPTHHVPGKVGLKAFVDITND